jgi:small subunit ribosomal protein S1
MKSTAVLSTAVLLSSTLFLSSHAFLSVPQQVQQQQQQYKKVNHVKLNAILSKNEKLQLRNGFFNTKEAGFEVIESESEYSETQDDDDNNLEAMLTEGSTFSYEQMDSELNAVSITDFSRGEIVKGTVVEIDSNGALIDVGFKAPAFLPSREVSIYPSVKVEDTVTLGQEIEFQVISDADDENGVVYLSLKRLEYERSWVKMQELQDSDESFECEVLSVNKGGAIVLVQGLRAFLPGSHLSGIYADESLVGRKLNVKFLEVNKEIGKLVVSHRRAVVESHMESVSRGDVVTGVVKLLKPYGAFVEVNGMAGLLHISQISYDRIDDLSVVLQPGNTIKCMIVDHDKVNGRIALSTKTLEPEPGDMLKDRKKVFDLAEETAKKYHERMEAERKAREEAAKDIVLGLSEGVDDLDNLGNNEDPLSGLDAFKVDPLAGLQVEPIVPESK